MLKEKYESCKSFVKEHKTEICFAMTGTGLAILTYKYIDLKKEVKMVKEIAKNSLEREYQRNNYEINKLQSSIAKANNSNINKFHNIPKKESRIFELNLNNKDIIKDMYKVQ